MGVVDRHISQQHRHDDVRPVEDYLLDSLLELCVEPVAEVVAALLIPTYVSMLQSSSTALVPVESAAAGGIIGALVGVSGQY